MKILKFGSATLADADKIKNIAEIIVRKEKAIIVLSSMKGYSEILEDISGYFYKKNIEAAINSLNKLKADYSSLISDLYTDPDIIREAKDIVDDSCSYIKSFSKDLFTLFEDRALMAQGELVSADLFYLYLKQENIKVEILPALEYMRTDRDSNPDQIFLKENIKRLMVEKPANLYITQGYITKNAYDEIDDLRKGGSDFTASLVGAAIEASEILIWEDVDVMQNNDPQYVENTESVKRISFNEAAELAYFGAEILHPTRISPAKIADIPVRLKSTQNPESSGTLITNQLEQNSIKAVAIRKDITAVRISSGEMLLAHGFLRRVLEIFERYHTSVDMLTTSEVSISVTIDDSSKLEYIVDDLKRYGEIEVQKNMAMISIVGDLTSSKTKILASIMKSLEDINIRMISYGGSELNFSILVEEVDVKVALNNLNNCLFLKKND